MIVLGLGGIVAYSQLKIDDYIAPEIITNTVVEEVKVDPVDVFVKEAIAEHATEIQDAAQASFDATVTQMEKEIELKVRQDQKKIDDEIIIELEKEVGVY